MKVNSVITLTTDFGISDPFVGIMKGKLGIKKGEKVVIKFKIKDKKYIP